MRRARRKGHLPKNRGRSLIAYGERSRFVTSLIRMPVAERHSPDEFGLTFHVLAPLQDSVGIITPNSLFYTATHRGAFVPDIDPRAHRLMIHGMVDRPLVFNIEEPQASPVRIPHSLHRVCLGKNRARPTHKTVQETHGLTSCAEWTGGRCPCCRQARPACKTRRPGSWRKAPRK